MAGREASRRQAREVPRTAQRRSMAPAPLARHPHPHDPGDSITGPAGPTTTPAQTLSSA